MTHRAAMLLCGPPAALATVRLRVAEDSAGFSPRLARSNDGPASTPSFPPASRGLNPDGRSLANWVALRLSKPLTPGRIVHCDLRDDAGVIDDPVAALYDDGQTLDLTLHGGAWVVEATLDLLRHDGFDVIDFDPIDPRCIDLCDGATLETRRCNAMLPLARTELAVAALFRCPLPDPHSPLFHPPTVAIVGPPNAGKSTLANALFGQQRSIVSPVAGTTRDWVGEEADLLGLIVRLIDTPGLRATSDSIEHEAITRSADVKRSSDLVIVLLDASESVASQCALRDQLVAEHEPHVMVVVNKLDRTRPEWHTEPADHRISAADGSGVHELCLAIRRRFVPWADAWELSA
jgi:small GTP-binding protein